MSYVRARAGLSYLRDEVLLVAALSGLGSVAAALLSRLPDARRLVLPNGGDAIVLGVIPLLLACLVVFVAIEPGVEIVLVVAARTDLLWTRAAIICVVPIIVAGFMLSPFLDADLVTVLMRNVAYGYAVGFGVTLLAPRRPAIALVCLPIVFAFFPGHGWWEPIASQPLRSFGVSSNISMMVGFLGLGGGMFAIRGANRRRWVE